MPGNSVQGGIIPASGFLPAPDAKILPAPVDGSGKGSMPKANAPIVRNDPAPGPRRRTAILPAPPTVADRPVRIPAMFSAPVPEERAALQTGSAGGAGCGTTDPADESIRNIKEVLGW